MYYAKGSYDNATEYDNEMACLSTVMDDHMIQMNAAMDGRDHEQAERAFSLLF